jgi:hypothetical protein
MESRAEMRVLLMISNSNMAIRERYSTVLRTHFPGLGVSNMSGLPTDPDSILKSFDVLVYELGAPDDPRRYQAILKLLGQLDKDTRLRIVTHIEGSFRAGIVAELESKEIVCVGEPFNQETIVEAFQRVAPRPRQARTSAAAGQAATSVGGRLRGLFRRRGSGDDRG